MARNMSNLLMSLSLWATLADTVLDPVRGTLQKAADKWFDWLLISSCVVAAGVVAEIWEATITLKRWWWLKHDKMVAEPNEKSWAIPVSYLGLLLVIAGVVGEGVFEARVSSADTALRAHDDQILAQAQQEAGDAKQSADGAAAAARLAQGSAKAAYSAAGTAQKKADAASTASGKAQDEANAVAGKAAELDRQLAATKAQLSVTASELVNARTQLNGITTEARTLEDSLAPRRLFFIQWEDGTTNLDVIKPLADTEFIIESIPDFEARKAAAEITATLRMGHFNVVQTAITEDFTWDGVSVDAYLGLNSDASRQQIAQEMYSENRALRVKALLWANGWKMINGSFAERGKLKPNQMRIRVGFKPSPFFRLRNPALDKMQEDETIREFAPYAQPIDQIKKKIAAIAEIGQNFPDRPK